MRAHTHTHSFKLTYSIEVSKLNCSPTTCHLCPPALAQPIVHHTQQRAAIDFCERMFHAVRERRFRLNQDTGKVYEATLSTDM